MSRYKYTIACALIILVVLALLVGRYSESRDCKARGGVYVQTFTGWECVR